MKGKIYMMMVVRPMMMMYDVGTNKKTGPAGVGRDKDVQIFIGRDQIWQRQK